MDPNDITNPEYMDPNNVPLPGPAGAATAPVMDNPEDNTDVEDQDQPQVEPIDPAEVEALRRQNAELESLKGRMGSEIGDLRRQQQEYAQKMAEMEHYLRQQNEPPPVDYEAQINDISQQMANGDIDMATGNRAIAQIVAESSAARARAETQQYYEHQQQAERQQQMESQYINQNPEFEQFLQGWKQGQFGEIAKQHPFYQHDPVAAYERYRAEQAISKLKEVEESGKRKGMKEIEKLSTGAKEGQRVLQDPGSAAAQMPAPEADLDQRKEYFIKNYAALVGKAQ